MNYNNSKAVYTTGNSIETFISGEYKFERLIRDIRAAKNFIHIEYYIFRLDSLGKKIIDELKKKEGSICQTYCRRYFQRKL